MQLRCSEHHGHRPCACYTRWHLVPGNFQSRHRYPPTFPNNRLEAKQESLKSHSRAGGSELRSDWLQNPGSGSKRWRTQRRRGGCSEEGYGHGHMSLPISAVARGWVREGCASQALAEFTTHMENPLSLGGTMPPREGEVTASTELSEPDLRHFNSGKFEMSADSLRSFLCGSPCEEKGEGRVAGGDWKLQENSNRWKWQTPRTHSQSLLNARP